MSNKTKIEQKGIDVDFYVSSLIRDGFTAEVYADHGFICVTYVTNLAKEIIWDARLFGSSSINEIEAISVGYGAESLISYTLDGEPVTLFEWLGAITQLLEIRFKDAFKRIENDS